MTELSADYNAIPASAKIKDLSIFEKLVLYYASESTLRDKIREDKDLLLRACKSNCTKLTTQLLQIFPSELLNRTDSDGYSAFLYACKNKMHDCISLLLTKDNINVHITSNTYETALEICIKNNIDWYVDKSIIINILKKDITTLSNIDSDNNNCLMLIIKEILRFKAFGFNYDTYYDSLQSKKTTGNIIKYLMTVDYPVDPFQTNIEGISEFMYVMNMLEYDFITPDNRLFARSYVKKIIKKYPITIFINKTTVNDTPCLLSYLFKYLSDKAFKIFDKLIEDPSNIEQLNKVKCDLYKACNKITLQLLNSKAIWKNIDLHFDTDSDSD